MQTETGETVRWSVTVLCIAVILVALTFTIYNYNVKQQQTQREIYQISLDKGYPPLTVKCALDYSYALNNELACTLVALKGTGDIEQLQRMYGE